MAPQVARVVISPFDDLLSFREAIRADASPPQNVAVLRQGTPGFIFLYADGVPIDRRQEGRILVGDIAVAAPHSRSVEPGFSRSKEKCALIRSFRGLDSRAGTAASSTFADGGVLHRWEHLRGSPWEAEVKSNRSPLEFFTPWTINDDVKHKCAALCIYYCVFCNIQEVVKGKKYIASSRGPLQLFSADDS